MRSQRNQNYFRMKVLTNTMKPSYNLLLGTISVSILTVIILMSYFSLSSSYFFNQYANAAAAVHSSSLGLQICCSWGNEIANGVLTYRIDEGTNQKVIQAIHQAVAEWNSKIPNIKLQEVTDSNADIDISTISKSPKVSHAISIGGPKLSSGKNIKLIAPGESQISSDSRGFITHVDITISTKALGNSIGSSELESIAKHEIGHAYGIGHTTFIGDLMSPVLTGRTSTDISQCDIKGIEEANS
ncbi:MAG TPA: matrixin family metalloprotease, partial [Nitrososphaeraceae archaeon]|nr:matrixin family metalloprotease [Nitrososphaeraceae archaeon]